jgi:hypothetical protein
VSKPENENGYLNRESNKPFKLKSIKIKDVSFYSSMWKSTCTCARTHLAMCPYWYFLNLTEFSVIVWYANIFLSLEL